MSTFKQKFERLEQKYLLTESQATELTSTIRQYFVPDAYGESHICNIYYDTPDWCLIRRSLDKPAYKEKLRLRTYGVPHPDSVAFAEIKKKYQGIVYKRRVSMTYAEALAYLAGTSEAPEASQITSEIDWMYRIYTGLRPAMVIACDRTAFFGRDDPELRVTFDKHLTWRKDRLDLTVGTDGILLLASGMCLMELKLPGAVPLGLAHQLDKLGIYPASFSKYGEAYKSMIGTEAGKIILTA